MSTGRTAWIAVGGRTHKVVLGADASASVDGEAVSVDLRQVAPGVLSLIQTLADGTTRSFRCLAEGPHAVVIDGQRLEYLQADPRSLQTGSAGASETGPKPLKSPMPGRIVRILVEVGDAVEAGQGCVVIEAMKMQNELKAARSGRVASLSATVGLTVGAGQTLLVIE